VIRGDDHLSNTPKQVLCYEALHYAVPEFAHVSMILGSDRSRLSKRHGATSVQAFRDDGVLPEAMVNYLVRLGWSHGDQEIFSRDELVERFDIKDVSSAGAVFDRTKLEWLNQHYMKTIDPSDLADRVRPFIEHVGAFDNVDPSRKDKQWLTRAVGSLRERAKTLKELAEQALFYFKKPGYTFEPARKMLTTEGVQQLEAIAARLGAVEDFTAPSLEIVYRELAVHLGVSLGDLAQLTRFALTGRTASPPLFDILELIGKKETLDRLRATRQFIQERLQGL